MFLQQSNLLNPPTRFLHRTTQHLNIARPKKMTIYKKWASFYTKSTLFHLQEKEKDCTTRRHLTVYFPNRRIQTQAVCSLVRVNAASRHGILCLNLIIRSWKLEFNFFFTRVLWYSNCCQQTKNPPHFVAPFYSFDKQKQKNIFFYILNSCFFFILKDLSSPLPKKTNTSKTQPSSSTITLTKTNQYLPKIKIQLYSVQVGLSTVFSCSLKVYAIYK